MAEGNSSKDLPRGLISRRGLPSGRGARLPSIGKPRDLTLGGVPKKVFIPNIPVRRDKSADKTEEKGERKQEGKQKTEKSGGRDERGRGRGRGRGSGRGRGQDVIQSHSIFEQGPTEKMAKGPSVFESYGGSGPRSGGGGGGSSGGGTKTGVKKERTDEESKQVLDYLLKDDFIAGPLSEDKDMAPVHLPLCIVEDIKPAVKIEADSGDVEMTEEVKAKVDTSIKIPSKAKLDQESCQHMFSSLSSGDPNQMVFVQFPDVMPGVPASYGKEEDAKNSNKDQTESSKKIGASPLSGFSEGHMGKLVIRKSGRTSLMLGNVVLDVSLGTKCGFLQDVVSIDTDSGGLGDLSVLGHVTHRLICTPDFDSLLQANQT